MILGGLCTQKVSVSDVPYERKCSVVEFTINHCVIFYLFLCSITLDHKSVPLFRGSKQFKHKPHYSNCIRVMTVFCSYVL